MKDSFRSPIDRRYFHEFATNRLQDYGAARKLALATLADDPETSVELGQFARLYLGQLARGIYITQGNSRVHREWIALSEKDQQAFWDVTGNSDNDRCYRHAQRQVLRKLERRGRRRVDAA